MSEPSLLLSDDRLEEDAEVEELDDEEPEEEDAVADEEEKVDEEESYEDVKEVCERESRPWFGLWR